MRGAVNQRGSGEYIGEGTAIDHKICSVVKP